MDIGTISLVLLLGLMLLLAIGMPLGMASAILAVLVLVMKFEPMLLLDPTTFGDGLLTRKFGTGPLNILAQKIYGLLTDYVLISVPLFIFMAALLERSGIAKDMYASPECLVVQCQRRYCHSNVNNGCNNGCNVWNYRW